MFMLLQTMAREAAAECSTKSQGRQPNPRKPTVAKPRAAYDTSGHLCSTSPPLRDVLVTVSCILTTFSSMCLVLL